ncbi:MAG: hypothetical protein LAN37_12105 [Acidobacteriia bacterium]|nr:hypothetical protein [Terriglobia bacterium]
MPKRQWNPKLIGERAECAFIKAAFDHALIVSKPLWDSAPYDFIVQLRKPSNRRGRGDRGGYLYSIQVKAVSVLTRCGYVLSTRRSLGHPYRRGDLDYFAGWIMPLDIWYIIPASEVIPAKAAALYPHKKRSRGKFEKFREAWHLLSEPQVLTHCPPGRRLR